MSFTTPTFDLLFESLQYKEKRQAKIAKNFLRAEKRIEGLLEKPQSAQRDEDVQSILDIQLWRLQRAKELVDEIADIKDVLDSMQIMINLRKVKSHATRAEMDRGLRGAARV